MESATPSSATSDGCWFWPGPKDRFGYGRVWHNGRKIGLHRLVWELAYGRKAEGNICHACDNPACINPAHLWVGTQADNLRDMMRKGRGRGQFTFGRPRSSATHCAHGHEFTAENTYNWGGRRFCRACDRLRQRRSTRRDEEQSA